MKKRSSQATYAAAGTAADTVLTIRDLALEPHLDEVSANLGLRERNKLEKAFLIRQAARELFLAKGYEATTLREVAK
ncbi:TetR family transcriptional regulator, partial [Burkholderia sola]